MQPSGAGGGQSDAELKGRRKSERGWAAEFRLAVSFKAEGLAGRSICLREVPVAKLCGRQAEADSVPDRSHTQEPQTDPLIKEMCSQCRRKTPGLKLISFSGMLPPFPGIDTHRRSQRK